MGIAGTYIIFDVYAQMLICVNLRNFQLFLLFVRGTQNQTDLNHIDYRRRYDNIV